jgi:hypothetical protein
MTRKTEVCHNPLCRKNGEIKNTVESIKHTHATASKLQKKVKATVVFRFVNSDDMPYLCDHCQHEVISGMTAGGMYD